MKIMITIISILIILAGVLPFLGENGLGILPTSIPTSGIGYSILVICIGIFGLIYAFVNRLLMGPERFVAIVEALLTIMGGIFPFTSEFISLPLPTSGPLYSALIILIGAIGLVYGIIAIG
jgi:hypothetical protein